MRSPLESDGIRWNQGGIFRALLCIYTRSMASPMVFLYMLQRVIRIFVLLSDYSRLGSRVYGILAVSSFRHGVFCGHYDRFDD